MWPPRSMRFGSQLNSPSVISQLAPRKRSLEPGLVGRQCEDLRKSTKKIVKYMEEWICPVDFAQLSIKDQDFNSSNSSKLGKCWVSGPWSWREPTPWPGGSGCRPLPTPPCDRGWDDPSGSANAKSSPGFLAPNFKKLLLDENKWC